MSTTMISSIAYELGEHVHEYNEAENFTTVMSEHRIPDMPELMGFGHYRKTSQDILSLAISSAKKTLSKAELSGSKVDVVLFCSTNFGVIEGDGREYVYQLCKQLNLTRAYPMGITLNNCTAFLSAIKMAEAMLNSDHYENILVVTADKVYDESQRCIHYGIFSDAAASCIVSNNIRNGYPIVSTNFRSDYRLIADSQGLNDDELYADVQRGLLQSPSYAISEIKKAFTSNIFVPITRAKESRAGLTDEQLYFDNVADKGHCFSADALINLDDYTTQNADTDQSPYLLSADADGLRVSLLVGPYETVN